VECYSAALHDALAVWTASDNCGGTPTVSWVSDSESNPGSSCNNIITRTYKATDACGNMKTCTQTITVNDTTAPVITCPPNQTVQSYKPVPQLEFAAET